MTLLRIVSKNLGILAFNTLAKNKNGNAGALAGLGIYYYSYTHGALGYGGSSTFSLHT